MNFFANILKSYMKSSISVMDTTFCDTTEQRNSDLNLQVCEDMEVDSSLIESDSHIISYNTAEQGKSSNKNGFSSELIDVSNNPVPYNAMEQNKLSEMHGYFPQVTEAQKGSYTSASFNILDNQSFEMNGSFSGILKPQILSHSKIILEQEKTTEINGNSLRTNETLNELLNTENIVEPNRSSEMNGNSLEMTETPIESHNARIEFENIVEQHKSSEMTEVQIETSSLVTSHNPDQPTDLNETYSETMEEISNITVCENYPQKDTSSEMIGSSDLSEDQKKYEMVVKNIEIDTTHEAETPHGSTLSSSSIPLPPIEKSTEGDFLAADNSDKVYLIQKPDQSLKIDSDTSVPECSDDSFSKKQINCVVDCGNIHSEEVRSNNTSIVITTNETKRPESPSDKYDYVCLNGGSTKVYLKDVKENNNGNPQLKNVLNFLETLGNELKHPGDIFGAIASMTDLSDKLDEQQQQNSELKLQLNALQQAKAALELEISKKEEIIIKTQAESLRNEQMYKAELKHLREELKENLEVIENDGVKELEEQLKAAKAREAKALAELAQINNKEQECQRIIEEYLTTMNENAVQYKALQAELAATKTHLANLELAFSDVHQKYEKTKEIIKGLRSNEDTLVSHMATLQQNCLHSEERYEALKAHAHAQIDKANRDNCQLKIDSDLKVNKLSAIIKRLEIKISALELSLQQKTEECEALNSLCDEVTGKK